MLNGIDPIILFQFSKRVDAKFVGPQQGSWIAKIPYISDIPTFIEAPPIPIYLNEQLTGIYIDSEDKHIDIETDFETLTNGAPPQISQKGLNSTVSINITGKKDSLGLALLSAMADIVFDKVTAQEYAITYLHGAITVFRGVLHSFSVEQSSANDLLTIKIELSKGSKVPVKPTGVPVVGGYTGAIPL